MRGRRVAEGMPKGPWSVAVSIERLCAPLLAAGVLAAGLVTSQLAVAQSLSGIHITSGPTVGRISGSTVTVTWTTNKAMAGKVKWGAMAGPYTGVRRERRATTDHSLTITRLAQNTTYHYRVWTGSARSRDRTFTTADYTDAPFTFAAMGDNRGASHQDDMVSVTPSFQNILNAAVAKGPAFTIHVGDIFHGPANSSEMQQMYSVFNAAIAPLASIGSFTISPGNHEMSPCSPPCTPDFDPFVLFNQEFPGQPQNGPPGYVGTCFSFDYGNTHVASIDTCRFDAQSTNPDWDFFHLSDAEIAWLDADLAQAQQNQARHLFVFGHGQAWSPDGVRWTSASSGTQADLNAVADRVAVGASGTILTSEDGATWTPQTSGTTATLNAIASGPQIVAAGDSGTILTSTTSGATWAPRVSGTTHDLNGVVRSDSLFAVAGESGTILTSSDGTTWTAVDSHTSQDLYGITEDTVDSQSVYVAVGKAGTILTSNDASTWTAQTSGMTEDLHGVTKGVANGQPLFAAVGDAGTILTSPDGVSWTQGVSGVTAALNAVMNDRVFIVLGDGGTVLTSEDGIEWVPQVSGSTSDLLGIGHWHPNDLDVSQYFAVGAAGTALLSPEWLGDSSLASYKSQRDAFWQVLVSHGVDAYICGHVHIFDDSFVQDGIVQWVDGNSGSTGTGNGRWTLWSIDGESATAQLLDENGNTTYTRIILSSQP